MDWYYEGRMGQAEGPVSEEGIKKLARTGEIRHTTLVWHEGMKDWMSYGELTGLVGGGASPGTGPPDTGICSECGRSFSSDDLIAYGNSRVCAACKPIFVQKLKEGVRPAMGFTYAGFWIRFGAKVIDWIIIYIVNIILLFVLTMFTGFFNAFDPETGPTAGFYIFQILNLVISFVIPAAYSTWMLGKYGATLGKMACRIKVVTAEGYPISYLRAFGRFFAELLSGMILLIGYLIAAFDSEKRTLHDRICSTRVVHK